MCDQAKRNSPSCRGTDILDITYTTDLRDVDWQQMKDAVAADDFDNGRTRAELEQSFKASAIACIAYAGSDIIGTARALSDGVCNAYVIDVWTRSDLRRRGIARTMLGVLEQPLHGQHIYLFADDFPDVYRACGFRERGVGLEKVPGTWLRR